METREQKSDDQNFAEVCHAGDPHISSGPYEAEAAIERPRMYRGEAENIIEGRERRDLPKAFTNSGRRRPIGTGRLA